MSRGNPQRMPEVRTVSSSGGEKGVKLARFDLLPALPLWLVAEVYGKGALKYTKYGDCTCTSVDAQQRRTHEGSADPAMNGNSESETRNTQSDSASSHASGSGETPGRIFLGLDPALTGPIASVVSYMTPISTSRAGSAAASQSTLTTTTPAVSADAGHASAARSATDAIWASDISKAGTPSTEKQHEPGCGALEMLQTGDRNWEKGYEWSKSYGALHRHLNQFWSGEDLDEDGLPHLAHAVFHCLALIEWGMTHPEFDDRPATVREREEQKKSTERLMKMFEPSWGTNRA